MVNRTELGGGKATPVSRRYIQPTQTYQNKDLQNIAGDISNLVTGLAVQNKKEKEVHNAEDKVNLVSKARQESTDIDNAMNNASYDDNLNKQVKSWRDKGFTETQIRNEARNYKYDKAIDYWGLTNADSEGTDEAQNAFFDVFTKLEDTKLTPIAEADTAVVVKDVKDELAFNFSDGLDDYGTKLKDAYEASSTYRNKISEDEIETMMIHSAVEKGDEDLIKDIKNSDGIPIIKTVEGKKAYAIAIEKRTLKEANAEVRDQREITKNQGIKENDYYKLIVANPDTIEDTMVQAKADYLNDKLSFSQYTNLQKLQGAVQPSTSNFTKTADPTILAYLNGQASVGKLPQSELVAYSEYITQAQFQSISTKALTNGGTEGYGKEGYDIMESNIKGFVKANSGLSILEKANATLSSIDLAQARANTMSTYLNTEVAKIVDETGELPTSADMTRLKKEAKEEANITDGILTEDGLESDDITKATTYEDLTTNLEIAKKTMTNSQWLSKLTPAQRDTYIAGHEARKKDLKVKAEGNLKQEDKLVEKNKAEIEKNREPTPLENTINQLFRESGKDLPFIAPDSMLGKMFRGESLLGDDLKMAEDEFVTTYAGLDATGMFDSLKQALGIGTKDNETIIRDLFKQVTEQDEDTIDWNFISKKEGAIKTTGYVPMDNSGKVLGKSGVTIGTGIDLGQWDESTLKELGVSDIILKKVRPYIGLKGEQAKRVASKLKLSTAESTSLTHQVKKYYGKKVEEDFNKDSTIDFNDLTREQRTVITSVAFQYGLGNTGIKSHNFWKQVTQGKWKEAKLNLENYGDKYSTRRKSEAELLSQGE